MIRSFASPMPGDRLRKVFHADVFIAVNSQCFHSAAIVAYGIINGKRL